MLHQDDEFKLSNDKSSHLLEVVQWLFAGIAFSQPLHVKCSWTFRSLAATALFWAWSAEPTMSERISCAQRLTQHLQRFPKRTTSRQSFMEVLVRHTVYLKQQLLTCFRLQMMTFSKHWKTYGYVVFGVDGSDVSVPRTASNQAAFNTNGESKHQKRKRIVNQNAHQKKQKECPRILMTTLFHITLGLPWSWRLGSKSDNERSQLISMLPELPENALIVGDAGFTGFEFLTQVAESGVETIIRVGSNVNLIKRLGRFRVRDGLVHVWPKWAMKKGYAPLWFRLVVATGGKQPVYLITSVLDRKQLSDKQVVRIYAMRWDIELYHRSLKQTKGHRKLLSRSPSNALVELEWIVLGYTAMMLYSVDELLDRRIDIRRLSPAAVIRAFRQSARDYKHPKREGPSLNELIAKALKDQYKRQKSKQNRNYPQRRKHRPPKPPNIFNATKLQRHIFRSLPA
jgi:hypothetical protein